MANLLEFLSKLKGGSGSGNFGHAGRIGKRGGSVTRGGVFEEANEQELKNLYKDFDKDCLKAKLECFSLNSYSGYAYEGINKSLRTDSEPLPVYKKFINYMDKAMSEAPKTQNNMTVYRRISEDAFNNLIKEGVVFQDKGFTSTTIKKGASGAGPSNSSGKSVENLEIRIPKGSEGIYIAQISHYKKEKEFLLPRNSKFRVVSVENNKAVLELIS